MISCLITLCSLAKFQVNIQYKLYSKFPTIKWHTRPPDKNASWKIIFLFLNQNICCGYSKEPSHWDGSYEHPKHMFKMMGKEIILGAQTILIWTYVIWWYEPWHEISNSVVCATSKDSDQPAHTRRLIKAFACRLNILWVLSYWLNIIWSF